jgi:hypothetical protein
MWHIWGRKEGYTGCWWGNLRARPRRRWEDNIKMDLQEVGGGRGVWREFALDRVRWRALVKTIKNLRVP